MATTFPNFETPWSEFAGEGRNYDLYRPGYPGEVAKVIVDHTLHRRLDSDIVDVGSGTGIFTRVLAAAAQGRRSIIGIEPNADMIQVAIQSTPRELNVKFRNSPAERLPFPDG
ncbi:class I SAM-dependent methyltransferase [Bradyrhizobium pachyrhizi]|uniref:class I SAM-dependent methyltransferase n=1 Tax=Bradyrhizobium pachyrhizi TaxID=280333 RepID=UPI0009E4183F|nr:class I SAM-dependent methyltransferase [Bradyrhizobium pachyrhizi]